MNANLHLREGRVEFRWKRWRNKKRQEVSYCLMVLFSGVVLLGGGGVAEAGPTGGQVTGGTGTITYGGPTTTINQQSQVLTINWQTFSTAPNETVNFVQPGSTSLAINYVVGGVPSVLEGALNATGRVYILNSAGITFTGTSHVNVGALLATTAMTVTGDPTASASFSGSGGGQVINQGSIQVSDGGFAILAAPYVENTGFIKADLGTIALAGTNQFTLDLRGDGLINFVVPPDAVQKIKSDGDKVGVNNTGTLQARSGQVLISASVATQVVNAVVNLSGVVDASAFAPDGQGGTVLVTSEGDINLGGQVTAAGAGTGAGGQIITKAVGADKVQAAATVVASGGASGGKGGKIEVSGHDVLLSGNINPGSGGTLLIDPVNFTIINNGISQGTNFIGEKKLEGILQNGVNFVASAANQIIMQDLSDNVLQGGNGALTLHAGNAIVFQGTNDQIVTKGGDITMTAGAGGIGVAGGPGHTVAIVSGGPGVSQAGDIILTTTAGGSIDVKSVSIKSSGAGAHHALFSANAAGNFSATGPIGDSVVMHGAGAQGADAEIHITAGNAITLHGVKSLASAVENGGGGNVAATALVDLTAPTVHDLGNASVTAIIGGHSGLAFGAVADLEINAHSDLTIGGNTLVLASGNVYSVSFENVTAFANLRGGNVDIAGFNMTAHGVANHVGNDLVHASGAIAGASVLVDGNASVQALGEAVQAAYVQAHGNFDISGAKVDVTGNAAARATADNANLGRSASASANLFVLAQHGNASFGGSLAAQALAVNGGGSKDADARANLGVTALGIDVADNVVVTANGQTLHVAGNQSSTPNASAALALTAESGDIMVHGQLYVAALTSSQNRDSVTAKAKAKLIAAGSVDITGLTGVFADAVTNATHFFANRTKLPPPLGALGSANLVIDAGGDVTLGHMNVAADALNGGNLEAQAFAGAQITAIGNITANSFDVEALAHQTNTHGGFAANGSAVAGLTLDAEAGDVTVGHFSGADFVGGNINVVANELDHGNGIGLASALVDITAANAPEGADIRVGDVNVEASGSHFVGALTAVPARLSMNASGAISAGDVTVVAIAKDHGPKAAAASALATFLAGGTVTLGAITDQAEASNHGGGAAKAIADVTIDPTVVTIGGPVKVSADALNFTGHGLAGNGASAGASLNFANASDVRVAGNVSVVAHGTNHGSGRVNAVGAFNFDGVASLDLQDVTIDVAALNQGHGSGGAKANALFSVGTGVALSLHGLNLQADASSNGNGGAVASAIGHITQAGVAISGDITVNAQAETGPNSKSNAEALASLSLVATSGNITVGNIDVEALANDHGAGNAYADAEIGLTASGLEGGGGNVTLGSLTDVASAGNDGAGIAKAIANATIDPQQGLFGTAHVSGNASVIANADNQGSGTDGIAASADAHLNIDGFARVEVDGNAVASAHATNFGSGGVNAHAGMDFASARDINLGGVQIDVSALNKGSVGGSWSAKATASFVHNSGFADLTVGEGGINVQAVASSHRGGGATANALVDIEQYSVSVAGGVAVGANAFNGAGGEGNANAQANLHLAASFSGSVTVDGRVDVEALANDLGDGYALANAQTGIFASGFEGGGVTIGSLLDKASANNAGGGFAKAIATASIDPPGVVHILGNASVIADAHNLDGTSGEGLAASADAHLSISGFATVTVDGNAVAAASATNLGSSGRVNAHAGMDFGNATTVTLRGVEVDVTALNDDGSGATATANFVQTNTAVHLAIGSGGINVHATASSGGGGGALASALVDIAQHYVSVAGDVTVMAKAFNGPGEGEGSGAHAIANLELTGGVVSVSGGSVEVDGRIDVEALATDQGAGDAVASALTGISAFGSLGEGVGGVVIGSLLDKASANNAGGGFAKAIATASIDPPGVVHILGNASVIADAHNLDGTSGEGLAASADAHLSISGFATVTVDGNAVAAASATNLGSSGRVNAHAGMDFGNATTVTLRGVEVDVTALNDDGSGATATANFVQTNTAVHLAIGSGGINVHATASSGGGGGALASALVDIAQHYVSVAGDVTVMAKAFNGPGEGEGSGAHAIANLELTGGVVSVSGGSVEVDGRIDVEALATDQGAGDAVASALTGISAFGSLGEGVGGVVIGSLLDKASANNAGGGFAKAIATASIDPPGVVHILGNASVIADAHNLDGTSGEGLAASADAHLSISGFATVTVDGNAVAAASATNLGSSGRVNAHAGMDFGNATTVTLRGVEVDVTALNDDGSGATATANFVQTNTAVHLAIGSGGINVHATASSGGGGGALASALVDIAQHYVSVAGDVTVMAKAFNGPGEGEGSGAHAIANLELTGGVVSVSGGSVEVDGRIDVEALATDQGAGDAVASALTGISAFGSLGEGVGGVVIGSLLDKASANNAGGGFAKAIATASIDPPGVVHILGNASVIADAHNLDGTSGEGLAASADAHLSISGFATVTVDGNAVAAASATNLGSSGRVNAHAGMDFGNATTVTLRGVEVDVTALNDDGSGATATANFVQTNTAVHLAIGSGGINVHATASSGGGGGALASALVDIAQHYVSVAGDVTVMAKAFNGPGEGEGSGAHAIANLELTGGVVSVSGGSVEVDGRIDVEALATDQGAGDAVASALTGISAFGSLGEGVGGVVIGSLLDKASANNAGGGFAKAIATASIDPPGVVHILGNASVIADAHNLDGTSGEGLAASADAHLSISGFATVTVDGNAVAAASATNLGSSGRVNAHAGMDFGNATTVTLRGVEVDVTALNDDGSGATATANFVQTNTAVHLAIGSGGINVHATASSGGGGGALASALVDIAQHYVSVAGDVTVMAKAFNGPGEGEGSGAHAIANLELTGGVVSVSGGSVEVDGRIDVEALATDQGAGDAVASALTGISAFGSLGEGVGGVVIGSLLDKASANNAGGGFAKAIATASIDPPGVVHILGNASVIADAHNLDGTSGEGLAASADAHLSISGFATVTVDGNAVAAASATNLGSSGRVNAHAGMDFGNATTVTLRGVEVDVTALNDDGSGATATANFVQTNTAVHLAIGSGGINVHATASSGGGGGALASALVDIAQHYVSVAGDVTVMAKAFNGPGEGEGSGAHAIANLELTGGVVSVSGGSVEVDGRIDVEALATDQGAGDAVASALTGISAFGSLGEGVGGVVIGSLLDKASANNAGGGFAKAIATASIDPPGVVHILGNASVIADAHNLDGTSGEGLAASADAHLSISGFATVTVDGNAVAAASATNLGSSGRVNAHAGMDFGNATTVTLRGVEVDVTALNDDGSGATATANFVQTNTAVHLAIGSGGINVHATASSGGGGGALASALVDIAQHYVSVAGGVAVGANAFNGAGGSGNANAQANLYLAASFSGSVTVDGRVDVEALANDLGGGYALANAQTGIFASGFEGGGVNIGSLLDKASAINAGGGYARAIATASIDPPGVAHITSNASVIANADNLGGGAESVVGASADAHLNFDGFATVEVGGNAVASAHATNHGLGSVNAHAGMNFGSASSINLGGVQIDVSALNEGAGAGGPGAKATASFVHDSGIAHLIVGTGGINVQAVASSQRGGGALANALVDAAQDSISIAGGVEVGANAFNGAGGEGKAQATANLLLDASTGAVNIGGGVTVAANADSHGTHGALANASANLFGGSVSVDGLARVTATAHGVTASTVTAYARFDASADSGDVSLGGLEIRANAQANDPLQVLATATGSLHAAGGIHIGQNAILHATASTQAGVGDPAAGSVHAVANLQAVAGSSVELGGNLDVTAQVHANKAQSALVSAGAKVEASSAAGRVTFDGDVLIQSNVQGGAGDNSVVAFATLNADAGSQVAFSGDLDVNAHAVSSGSNVAFAAAVADLQAGAIQVQGNVAVNASGLGQGGVQDAGAVASFLANADTGSLLLGGNFDVHARGVDPGSGQMLALGRANLLANDGITVDGNIDVTGSLTGNGLAAGSIDLTEIGIPNPIYLRFGSASLNVEARHGNVDLNGVTVLANGDLTATGTPHSASGAGTAGAWAVAQISADQGNLTIDGPTHVGANADDLAAGDHARAVAILDAFAGDDLQVGGVTVNADLTAAHAHNASAVALGRISASGSHLSIDGQVNMQALVDAGSGVTGNVAAIAALRADAAHGSVAVAGGVTIDANALDLGTQGAAAAYANGDIIGADGVTIDGQTKVIADLKTNTRGGGSFTFALASGDTQTVELGWAKAGLSIDPSGASAGIKTGAITVSANADLMAAGPNSGGAGAYLDMTASNGSVVINGPLLVTGQVAGEGTQGGNASAVASARIHGRRGVSLGTASVLAVASALGGGTGQNADAEAVLELLANDGNIHANSVDAAAVASHMGSHGQGVAHANALASVDASNGNVDIIGGAAIALAYAPKDSVSYAAATAALDLYAGQNLGVHGGGLIAEALANGTFGQAPGHANALIDVTAGSDVFIAGNIVSLAAAKGSHSGQVATANINVHAGTAGFGSLDIFGNVVALASADPVNDHALASITLAANRILLVGANPVASANAGDVTAYLKTHFTRRRQRFGPNGSSALARITITTDPGGLIVINDSGGGSTGTGIGSGFSRTNADALLALPIYDQTYPSGAGVRPIPLTIDGKLCGMLGGAGGGGQAGADNKPPAACEQPPINLSGLVDGP